MLRLNVAHEGHLSETLDRLSKGLKDLSPIQGAMKTLVLNGNREGLGTDRDGAPLEPVKLSTMKRRGGNGPPLAPHGTNSRIVTQAQVDSTVTPNGMAVELSWPSLSWLKYAAAKRNIVGIRPQTLGQVNQELLSYYNGLIA
jgi:hypothetical protein